MYSGYYAPFQRQIGYYNPSLPVSVPAADQVPQVHAQGDMIWVLNETEATAYPVAPGNDVTLWDKTKPTCYVKSVSTQGVPSMRILDYTERAPEIQTNTAEKEALTDYASKSDVETIKGELEHLKGELEVLKQKQKPKAKKETSDDE